LIVGELNPYGQDQRYALYHWPRHASGNRLREHLGLTDQQYVRLRKMNLCTGKWTKEAAHAGAMLELHLRKWDVIVMLGKKVREAFDQKIPFFTATEVPTGTRLISLPHPSGLNRLWNEPDARSKARALVRQYAPEITSGP
jgi:uracil-DNA glycosylase